MKNHLYLLALALALASTTSVAAQTVRRPSSISSEGTFADSESRHCALSHDGRYLVFQSAATNLDPEIGANGLTQVYLHDRYLKTTKMVSVRTINNFDVAGNGHSSWASLARDSNGHTLVIFQSEATNLNDQGADTNGKIDVFVRDVDERKTWLVSRRMVGGACQNNCHYPAASADGSVIAFQADRGDGADVLVVDRIANTVQRANMADDGGFADNPNSSGYPAVSGNGRYVVFKSDATNLVQKNGGPETQDVNGGNSDVFRFDRLANSHRTLRVSVAPSGGFFAEDGSPVAEQNISGLSLGAGSVSEDGRFVAFTIQNSILANYAVFVRDLEQNTTALVGNAVSAGTTGAKLNDQLKISANGQFGVFYSLAYDLQTTDPSDPNKSIDTSQSRIFSVAAPLDSLPILIDEGRRGEVSSELDDRRAPCLSGDGTVIGFERKTPQAGVQIFTEAVSDLCVNDSAKEAPGICGCGAPDIGSDSDSDGVYDCRDSCPSDPAKSLPGICGCNNADSDTDSDGIADCFDACPVDATKTGAGLCGCGRNDLADSDSDGVLDCNDQCPEHPQTSIAGVCGCGVPALDLNANAITDCLEATVAAPVAPRIITTNRGIRIRLPKIAGVKYAVTIAKRKQPGKERLYPTARVLLKKLKPGRYRVRYRIVVGAGLADEKFGPYSQFKAFVVK